MGRIRFPKRNRATGGLIGFLGGCGRAGKREVRANDDDSKDAETNEVDSVVLIL